MLTNTPEVFIVRAHQSKSISSNLPDEGQDLCHRVVQSLKKVEMDVRPKSCQPSLV